MTSSSCGDPVSPGMTTRAQTPPFDNSVDHQAVVSSALASGFRGKFCDFILPNRTSTRFNKHDVIYDVGDDGRMFFFLQSGFVKVGTITPSGNETIYDVRRSGDVIGELCASEKKRLDRAVALEQTDAISVPFEEIMAVLLQKPDLVAMLVEIFCQALKEAYAQVNTFASDDIIHRLSKVLLGLAVKIGQKSGSLVEIPTYLTQEEIAQMVAARRERVSTALNSLRRQGMVHYSTRGHLMLDMSALERHAG
jgi:CRP/FNR family transcriptional regulator